MIFNDLRDFIQKVDDLGDLKLIQGADYNLEIGAITELAAEKNGPALLFDNIKTYPKGYRILTNVVATYQRMGLAFNLAYDLEPIDMVQAWKDRAKKMELIPPAKVSDGPVKENIISEEEIDLYKFPVPKWHELDGGRYIGTGDAIIMEDPDEGWINVGTYRVQIHDKSTVTIYTSPGRHANIIRQKYWEKGKNCPVAVSCGHDPALAIAAIYPQPWGTSEYDVTGGIRGEPVKVIDGEYTGLPIPATAEIVLEGEIISPNEETRLEGPFGEWPGYYGIATQQPIMKVKKILHRNDPILLGAPPMKPPASSFSALRETASLWEELEKTGISDIKGVWINESGGSMGPITIISIKQRYAGHATQTGLAAMGARAGAYMGRFTIVVDEDVDISNINDVLWAVSTRCDPENDIQIIKNCWSSQLDPRIPPERKARREFTNSRALIIACRPFTWYKDFPKINVFSQNYRNKILKKWKKSGLF